MSALQALSANKPKNPKKKPDEFEKDEQLLGKGDYGNKITNRSNYPTSYIIFFNEIRLMI